MKPIAAPLSPLANATSLEIIEETIDETTGTADTAADHHATLEEAEVVTEIGIADEMIGIEMGGITEARDEATMIGMAEERMTGLEIEVSLHVVFSPAIWL
jgi:hypothetical protein